MAITAERTPSPRARGWLSAGAISLLGLVGLAVAIALVWGAWAPHVPALDRLVIGVLVAPVLEEIVFRGGVQEALWRAPVGRLRLGPLTIANVLTSILFALAHALVRQQPAALIVGLPSLVFGWAYDRHRQLLPPVAAHAGYNALWLCLVTA